MTIPYEYSGGNGACHSPASMVKLCGLMMKWRGSVWRSLGWELALWLVLYGVISLLYRGVLPEEWQLSFTHLALWVEQWSQVVPLTFVLGFFTTQTFTRWWASYSTIPWPDNLALLVDACVPATTAELRQTRMDLVRWANLSQAMVHVGVSRSSQCAGIDSLDALVERGLMTADERAAVARVESTVNGSSCYWMPCSWFSNACTELLRKEEVHPLLVQSLLGAIGAHRGKCGGMLDYAWVRVPLAYTQLVSIAVYAYFIACLVGRQYLDPRYIPATDTQTRDIDLIVPIFTVAEFLVLVGWLKVSQSMLDPCVCVFAMAVPTAWPDALQCWCCCRSSRRARALRRRARSIQCLV